MPRRPPPLPPSLAGTFTTAHAMGLGVTRSRLRAGDLRSPSRGIRTQGPGPGSVHDTVRETRAALTGEWAFSHLTAARLLGLPTPRPWVPDEPVHVMRASGTPLLERRGVRSHRGLETRSTLVIDGVPVTDPVVTWVDLGAGLGLDDLVAIGDVLLGDPFGVEPRELRRAVQHSSARGVRRLRVAADLVRPGARSAWESKSRVAFASWGLPEPELNADVHSEHGWWLARPDFVWRRRKVFGEYDGDQHRTDRRSWQYERERRARLEDDGWTYVELTSLSLTSARHREALRSRLTRLLL